MSNPESTFPNHTPGPWAYQEADHDHTPCEHAFDIVSERRPFVATVLGGALPGASQANARLIAAAPDLLLVLLWFQHTLAVDCSGDIWRAFQQHPDGEYWTEQMDAAIKAATTGEPTNH